MKKKENDNLLFGCIGILIFLYFVIQVIDVFIDEVFRKGYFKNLNFVESLGYIFFFTILLNTFYLIALERLYIPRFPNSKIFSSYPRTIVSILIFSTFHTFLIEKIFDADLSMLQFALIINILLQSYYSFSEIEGSVSNLKKSLRWHRNGIFRMTMSNSKVTVNLPVGYNAVFEENYFLIKLPKCNLTVYKGSPNIIFKCYDKTLTRDELLSENDIQPKWELIVDYEEYGFVIDNFIDLLEDQNNLREINTKDSNALIGFLNKY